MGGRLIKPIRKNLSRRGTWKRNFASTSVDSSSGIFRKTARTGPRGTIRIGRGSLRALGFVRNACTWRKSTHKNRTTKTWNPGATLALFSASLPACRSGPSAWENARRINSYERIDRLEPREQLFRSLNFRLAISSRPVPYRGRAGRMPVFTRSGTYRHDYECTAEQARVFETDTRSDRGRLGDTKAGRLGALGSRLRLHFYSSQ